MARTSEHRAGELRLGDVVEITPESPLECEGVAPLPGDVGEAVAEPEPGDVRRNWRVRFTRVNADWLIPERFLRRAGMH